MALLFHAPVSHDRWHGIIKPFIQSYLTTNVSFNWMFSDEVPIRTSNSPGSTVHSMCRSKIWRSSGRSVKETVFFSPGCKVIRSKTKRIESTVYTSIARTVRTGIILSVLRTRLERKIIFDIGIPHPDKRSPLRFGRKSMHAEQKPQHGKNNAF